MPGRTGAPGRNPAAQRPHDSYRRFIAAIVGEPSFGDLAFTINGSEFRYGAFINAVIVFIAAAAAIYYLVVVPYKAYQEREGVSAKTRLCPECTTAISVAAKRGPACTARPATAGV